MYLCMRVGALIAGATRYDALVTCARVINKNVTRRYCHQDRGLHFERFSKFSKLNLSVPRDASKNRSKYRLIHLTR